jgi:hypothetical protein
MDDIFNCVIAETFGFGGGKPPITVDVMAGIVDPLALTPIVLELIIGLVLPPLLLLLGILSEITEFSAGFVGPPVGLAPELPDTG